MPTPAPCSKQKLASCLNVLLAEGFVIGCFAVKRMPPQLFIKKSQAVFTLQKVCCRVFLATVIDHATSYQIAASAEKYINVVVEVSQPVHC